MIGKLICITLICVFIVDFSGIVESIKTPIAKWLKCRDIRLKPFDCSLCMVWWSCLLCVAIERQFTLHNILLCALCALFADKVAELLSLIRDMFSKLINFIYKLLKI